MKKILIVLLVITGVSVTSCKKILEVSPQNQLDGTLALSDINGYQAVLISVYDRLQSYTFYGRDMALEGDALADNIYTSTANASGRYTGANIGTRSSTYNIWTAAYAAINDLNTIIAGIDAVPVVGATQTQLQIEIKAEAFTLRGLMYFDLARVYGYEPNRIPLAGTNIGFDRSAVLRLKPTTSVADTTRKNRSSITETYTQIESDFKTAITTFQTLANRKPTTPYRVSESATHAYLGKMYLYSQRWSEASTEFDNALDASNKVATMTPIVAGGYVSAFKKIPNPESILELYYNQSVEVTGVTGSNDAPFTYTQPSGTNASNLSTFGGQTVSAELLALFEPVDDRKGMFFSANSAASSTVYTWCNKYSGAGGAYTDNICMIRYSDVILMKAEAQANLGNYAAAQTLVKQIRAARNATTTGVPADITLLDYIQTERRRELFFEGHRWFDLKRTGSNIPKPAATAVGTIPYNDARLLAPLPSAEVLLNPLLPQNPTY